MAPYTHPLRHCSVAFAAALAMAAQAQVPAPLIDSGAGAVIDTTAPPQGAPSIPGIGVVPMPPIQPVPAITPLVPPVRVSPAAGVVPTPPGATGPVVRPELGKSGIDGLQFAPPPNTPAQSTSPAEAAQKQLMIEREDRVRGLNR